MQTIWLHFPVEFTQGAKKPLLSYNSRQAGNVEASYPFYYNSHEVQNLHMDAGFVVSDCWGVQSPGPWGREALGWGLPDPSLLEWAEAPPREWLLNGRVRSAAPTNRGKDGGAWIGDPVSRLTKTILPGSSRE